MNNLERILGLGRHFGHEWALVLEHDPEMRRRFVEAPDFESAHKAIEVAYAFEEVSGQVPGIESPFIQSPDDGYSPKGLVAYHETQTGRLRWWITPEKVEIIVCRPNRGDGAVKSIPVLEAAKSPMGNHALITRFGFGRYTFPDKSYRYEVSTSYFCNYQEELLFPYGSRHVAALREAVEAAGLDWETRGESISETVREGEDIEMDLLNAIHLSMVGYPAVRPF